MAAESGSAWHTPFARCTGCVYHCSVEITALRPVHMHACVQGLDDLDEVAWQVVMPQGIRDKAVVYGSECICLIQPAHGDVVLGSSCIEDGLPQLELVLCAPRNTFNELRLFVLLFQCSCY